MSKPFFDVFPKLRVRKDLREYFENTSVERLAANRERTRLKVCLYSEHLIHKDRVFRMQQEMEEQLFSGRKVKVYVEEHYRLSALYTPRRLMEEYNDSICCEISSFSHIMGAVFREARITYGENGEIDIHMQDTCISRGLRDRLEEALNRIFRDRCGIPATITVNLEEKPKSQALNGNTNRPAHAAAGQDSVETGTGESFSGFRGFSGVVDRSGGTAGQNQYGTDDSLTSASYAGTDYDPAISAAGSDQNTGISAAGSGSPQAAANPEEGADSAARSGRSIRTGDSPNGKAASSAGSGSGSPGGSAIGSGQGGQYRKNGFRGKNGRGRNAEREYTLSRSSHPDVIYGKEIVKDAIPISDVIGEIGEVVVRGKILGNDRRDIRNEKTIIKFSLTDFTDTIYCKVFVPTDKAGELLAQIGKGSWVKVRGAAVMDTFDREVIISSIQGIMKIPGFIKKRASFTATRK